MALLRLLLVAAGLMALAASAQAGRFALENGYFSVSGENGVITSLRLDPTGKGRYGRNHIISLSVGNPFPDPNARAEVSEPERRLVIRGMKFTSPMKIEQTQANFAQLCVPGGTIGQTFVVERGILQSVEVHVPTWHTTDSAATLTLYRMDGDRRTKIASQRYENLVDGAWIEMQVPDAPAGTFLLEMSDVKGTAGWWSQGKDLVKGEALVDGQPRPNEDRCFRAQGYEIGVGDFEITLEGNKMRTRFTPPASSGTASPDPAIPSQSKQALQTRIVLPWVKSGYDTTSGRIIFHHFLTSEGLYIPVHQFKRRPWSGVSGPWVLMSGRFGSDLKFPHAAIHLRFDEDSMAMVFPGCDREIELLPHKDELDEQFPVFYSSDPKTSKILNEFLLSHNFNFGVGTNPDWKDWHTLQLSWTANRQCIWQRQQFLDFKMNPDGYVYCWGADPGWPFPYKDEDNDGKNDYDTRHFTSNPCFILGAWREYCWNPDPDYLAKLMPRVRLAMGFMLKEMDGDKGILIAKAPGHEGKDRCIGSNYWDITPFGWKDAFTNAHYYPSLEAMAQLEEAYLRCFGTRTESGAAEAADDMPPRHTPRYYRRLAEVVRKSYNDTFWLQDKGRYSGCVDIDGVTHDYGFTYVNLPAAAYGLASPEQVRRIYDWMENGLSSSGKRDIYSRWVFAPRACSIHNPKRDEPQEPVPSWWSMAWNGTAYDEQCQDGGAILYTSFHDILARARYLGADNAWQRFMEILERYSEPDHLSGGSPLYRGETTQGGPGGSAGSVGVEGEFPESGLVPVSFLYAFLGIEADVYGLKIRPNLPSALKFGGVRNLRYKGLMYDIRVTNNARHSERTQRAGLSRWSIEIRCTTRGRERTIRAEIGPGGTYVFKG